MRLAACLYASAALALGASDAPAEQAPAQDQIERLKAQARAQQEEIEELRQRLDAQQVLQSAEQPEFQHHGLGVSLNALLEIAPLLTLITTNYYSNGGGDCIFGEAPDLIIQAPGAPSLLPSGSTVDGLEYNPTSKWEFWAYYGGTWIGRISTFDPVAVQPVGYGSIGSLESQNRTSQEGTAGFPRTFWNNPNTGAFNSRANARGSCGIRGAGAAG